MHGAELALGHALDAALGAAALDYKITRECCGHGGMFSSSRHAPTSSMHGAETVEQSHALAPLDSARTLQRLDFCLLRASVSATIEEPRYLAPTSSRRFRGRGTRAGALPDLPRGLATAGSAVANVTRGSTCASLGASGAAAEFGSVHKPSLAGIVVPCGDHAASVFFGA